MQILIRIANLFDRIGRWCGTAFGWIIVPLIMVIMFDVITRKLDYTRLMFSEFSMRQGGISISTILQDMQWHFHAVLLMMSFGFGYLANAHVRVDIFRELLPRKKQAWLELVGLIIFAIPFALIMIDESFQMTALAFSQGEGSESLTGIGKRWIIKAVVPIGFTVLLGAIIATLFRLIGMLFGNDEVRAEAERGLQIFTDEAGELEAARLAAERALAEEGDDLDLTKGH
ncbi:MAG: TRAP transporter small permease subunit [Burkholderiaceae bacterium]